MIYVTNTPNNTGIAIHGDYNDFETLYEALHKIVGDEEEFPSFGNARFRVLGVCYDIRHALMGDREIEFVNNGMDADKMRRLATITYDKNIYLFINVLWPEILFVTMALNDFVLLYARKQVKNTFTYSLMTNKRNIWDDAIAQVRVFQVAIAKCIKETVSDASFSRMINLLNKDYTWVDGFATQYVDMLNCKFLGMDKEKRLKNIPTMAKRLADRGQEYIKLESELKESAKMHKCSVGDLRLQLEFPEDIDW